MFLGRKSELGRLRKEIEKSGKSAVLLYGRRRIGKTTLIEEALKGCSAKIIRFSAVPDELSENAKRLSLAVGEALGTPMLPIPDFEAVLKYISGLREPVVFAIDEYQDLRLKRKGDIVDAYFRDFLRNLPPDEMKAECLLPIMVNDFLQAGRMRVKAERSGDQWFGLTYHEDLETVSRALSALRARGVYPEKLF